MEKDKKEKYKLLRLDDNNNTFVMKNNLELEEAKALQIEYENRGHKQIYFIEKEVN